MAVSGAASHFTVRLRGLFDRQSQFIVEASHELRTPLAALKARLELGLRERGPQQWRATLADAVQNTDRVTGLDNRLLSLAWVESGARAIAEGAGERIELSQLAWEPGLVLAPLAHSRGAGAGSG